ncbi:hypothetical protein [uncultured Rubinisphaera sp.]|uniref:hypothetical protein n=1 Tax=uncultured Rubinisphaera sp. TaxID=1678686 RepID=UPI0030D9DE6B
MKRRTPNKSPLPRRLQRRPRRKRFHRPALKFSPTAWAKLIYLRDAGPTEVGGFGISSQYDLLYVEELVLLPQICTAVTVSFAEEAIADYFDQQIDRGLKPEQFARIWIHTHPGESPEPSPTDLDTMETSFGECDWAVMFILAREGKRYAELRWNRMQDSRMRIKTSIDYQQPFAGTDYATWQNEYDENVVDQSQNWTDLMEPDELWEYGDLFDNPHSILEFNA